MCFSLLESATNLSLCLSLNSFCHKISKTWIHEGSCFQIFRIVVAVVQSLSCVQIFVNSWNAAHLASLSFTISQSLLKLVSIESVSSVTQLCPTRCNSMDCSTPGFPVHHQLPDLAQTHVHWVSDAIQPSPPLSSTSPPALYLSQHQGLFQWVSSLHQVARVLEFQLQHQSFQWIIRTDFL